MELIDISRPLSPEIAVWPGDTPYSHDWVMRLENGASVNLSTLTLSAHTGTHADAPLHFASNGVTIDQMNLGAYLGPAVVAEIERTGPISVADLQILDLDLLAAPRLLLRTPASAQSHSAWSNTIAYLAPEAVRWLGQQGILLFGTDAPSVDDIESKTLENHHILHSYNIAILENLFLRDVTSGIYELIALPLRLHTDASPVRAILRTL
jgi:arylformamidase